MNKILVTGAGGFVGNVLIRDLLNNGCKVRGLDNFHKGQCDALFSIIEHPNFEFLYGDVTNVEDVKKALDGCDGIVHLAAIVGFPACKRQPALSRAVNVEGTKNVVELSQDIPLVFASTGSVYGKVENICKEDSSSTNPQSLYGIHKLEAEHIVTSRDKAVALRFSTAFGISPCMRVNLLINDLAYKAVTEGAINVFQPEFRRSFLSVQDMSRAFIWALDRIASGRICYDVYNVGDERFNWTKRQVAEYIKSKTGCYVSYNESGVDADQRDYEIDFSRLHKDGFYCSITMEQGLEQLIKAIPLLQIRHQYE